MCDIKNTQKQKIKTILQVFLLLLVTSTIFCVGAVNVLKAQEIRENFDIINTYNINDEDFSDGDIVSHNPETDTYILSRRAGDQNIFGVMASTPVFVFQGGPDEVPVVTSGTVVVNVFLKNNEEIKRGDLVTSSSLPGKAKKAQREDTHILGAAKTSLSPEETQDEITIEDENFPYGKILVKLEPGMSKSKAERAGVGGEENAGFGRFTEATVTNIIQYLVAGFIAIGSLYVSFQNFMPNLQKGIISMGRNPRAKASIRSMVIFNAFLMVLVGIGGLLIAVGIILLPI